jgi:ADP-heptose:LPS heptosyltransferase
MTVAELIAKLQQMPSHTVVLVWDAEDSEYTEALYAVHNHEENNDTVMIDHYCGD